jgi:CRP/FNR family transcriptional regulator, anaerobic regulatory protein
MGAPFLIIADTAGAKMVLPSQADWTKDFPPLRQLLASDFARLREGSMIVVLPEGSRIFGPGQAPENFLLLVEGTIRVQQVSEGGREIVLYRVSAGESCALTTACLMGYEEYLAEGIAETTVKAVAIPRSLFDELITSSREFRRFVFTAFSRRVTDLFRIIEEVAFTRIDVRLAQRLLSMAAGKNHV